jgi:hypothetical protein
MIPFKTATGRPREWYCMMLRPSIGKVMMVTNAEFNPTTGFTSSFGYVNDKNSNKQSLGGLKWKGR